MISDFVPFSVTNPSNIERAARTSTVFAPQAQPISNLPKSVGNAIPRLTSLSVILPLYIGVLIDWRIYDNHIPFSIHSVSAVPLAKPLNIAKIQFHYPTLIFLPGFLFDVRHPQSANAAASIGVDASPPNPHPPAMGLLTDVIADSFNISCCLYHVTDCSLISCTN